jgi:large subunit ribosomal protein L23
MKPVQSIIVKPIVTEKSATMTQSQNLITFEVDRDANKIEIRKAVETLFSVKVKSVRCVKQPGKIRRVARTSGRFIGKTSERKKAYVTLKAGEKLPPIFEGV